VIPSGRIEIFTGLMGSGKTLYAVDCILKTFLRGAIVATNIELNLHYVIRWLKWNGVKFQRSQYIYLTPDKLTNPHVWLPKGTSENPNELWLDECLLLYSNRGFAETQKNQGKFLIFLTMLRREFTNCFFLVQRPSLIDKQIRILFQFRWHFNNLGRALVLPFLGSLPWQVLVRVLYDQTDQRLSYKFCLVSMRIARCYNTYQQIVNFGRDQKTITIQKGRPIWRIYQRIIRMWVSKLLILLLK